MKMVLLGDGAVGKTSLIQKFVSGQFAGQYKATIGVDLFKKGVIVDGQSISLQVWDLAGQEFFKKYHQHFLGGALGAFLVFDLTVPPSLKNLNTWIRDTRPTTGGINYVLIGNKVDLAENRDDIKDKALDLAMQYDISFFETSALTGEGIDELFTYLASNFL